MAFVLRYLFYAGIIVPTVVTLALFIFFVICWRRQSARKHVLTKPYDPHGSMRRLGIPNRPPPPPLFMRDAMPTSYGTAGPSSPLTEGLGGEDNAAYDMSRSPSAEANTQGHQQQQHLQQPQHQQQSNNLRTMTAAGLHHLRLQLTSSHSGLGLDTAGGGGGSAGYSLPDQGMQLMQFSPSTDLQPHPGARAGGGLAARGGPPLPTHPPPPSSSVIFSPSRELSLLAAGQPQQQLPGYHSRLDSGLSEPSCESPGAASNHSNCSGSSASACSSSSANGLLGCGSGLGGGGVGGGTGREGGGGGGGNPLQDRPQSQASQSSHSTDSEDSGFRSARSGQFAQQGGSGGGSGGPMGTAHPEPPLLRRSRSGGRSRGRGYYHKAATSSPDSETEAGIQLTPAALWPHHYNHQPLPTSSPDHQRHNHHHHHHHLPSSPLHRTFPHPSQPLSPSQHPHLPHYPPQPQRGQQERGSDDLSVVKTGAVDLTLAQAPHLEWKYLQDLASPTGGGPRGRGSSPGVHKGQQQQQQQQQQHHHQQYQQQQQPQAQTMTCHQMTMAQVHVSHDLDNPEVFGFSVV